MNISHKQNTVTKERSSQELHNNNNHLKMIIIFSLGLDFAKKTNKQKSHYMDYITYDSDYSYCNRTILCLY